MEMIGNQVFKKKNRSKVINCLKKFNGKLIEIPFTKNISSTEIKNKILKLKSYPDNRTSKLRRL